MSLEDISIYFYRFTAADATLRKASSFFVVNVDPLLCRYKNDDF
jgi:hypothetical protein